MALTITPLFGVSITGAANALQIEAGINDAIGTIDLLYSNPGTVSIVFNQTSGAFLGQSETANYTLSYAAYTADLTTVALRQTSNIVLSTAIANLSSGNKPSPGGAVVLTLADARVALGLAGFTGCFNSSGIFVSGCGQSYDGVVTLTTNHAMNYGKTAVAREYSALNTVEHEINEILGGGGQGSVLNAIASGNTAYSADVGALDLYRYSAQGVASFTTSSGASSYFSVDGGASNIAGFNQSSSGDYADFSTPNNIQSAFVNSGIALPYNSSSPEFQLLESIGYSGVVPEPASVAMLVSGIVGLRTTRRRARLRPVSKVRRDRGLGP